MSNSDIWPAVHTERQALICDLQGLSDEQWQTPSLCAGWDVHDVLAHLLDTAKTTRLGFVRLMVAARFDFDRVNAVGLEREKSADPQATLREFTAAQDRTSTPPASLATRLVEAFVHGEDIRRPLGIKRDYPTEHVLTALRYQLATGVSMGGGKERARGVRLIAVDAGEEFGSGPEVSGTAMALLLAVSGRRLPTGELTGDSAGRFER